MHDAAIFGFCKKLFRTFILDRMVRGRGYLHERHQNKTPLGHTRMWNLQVRGVNDARAIKQNIDIDHAGASADGMFAAEFIFDFLECSKKLTRHQVGFNFQDTIQKPGLRGDVNGLGRID